MSNALSISTGFIECWLPRIEPCKVVYSDGTTRITPDMSYRSSIAHASYVNSCTGLNLNATEVASLLEKMTLEATVSPNDADEVLVKIPPTRPDILHECDIMEDAAIAYGFNKLPDTFPHTSTVAQPLAISKLSDIVRREWAEAGWVEVLPLILVNEYSALAAASDPDHLFVSVHTKKTSNGSTAKMTARPRSESPIPRRSNSKWYARRCYRVSSRRSGRTVRIHSRSEFLNPRTLSSRIQRANGRRVMCVTPRRCGATRQQVLRSSKDYSTEL